MPRTTRADAYGPEYEQLLLLSFASSMKRKVYAYWKALRTENLRPDLVEKSNLLSLRVEGGALVVFRREDAWDARALRESMGLEKGFADTIGSGVLVAKSPTDALVERLHQLRGESEK